MSKQLDVLIDSDAFIGNFYPDDAHHQEARRIFTKLEQQKSSIVTTSLVITEAATVLSYKSGQDAARKFLGTLEHIKLPIIHINEILHKETFSFFKKQKQKGTSVVDCANVVIMQRFQIPTIFSFDKFYLKQAGLRTVTNPDASLRGGENQ